MEAKTTKFEQILSEMSLGEKADVMRNLSYVFDAFKEKCGDDWIEAICNDEPLKNLYIMSAIASQQWFTEYKNNEKNQ